MLDLALHYFECTLAQIFRIWSLNFFNFIDWYLGLASHIIKRQSAPRKVSSGCILWPIYAALIETQLFINKSFFNASIGIVQIRRFLQKSLFVSYVNYLLNDKFGSSWVLLYLLHTEPIIRLLFLY